MLPALTACPSDLPFRLPFQQQGGTFSVSFSWNGVPPPRSEDGLYVLGEVRQRASDGTTTTVRTAGPVLYAPGATRLDFGGIEPGNGYGVVVEFRPGTSREIPVRYYGISADFDLHPNDRRTVEVRVGMRGAPGVTDPRAFRVANVPSGGVLNTSTVDLFLGGPAGERVRLSNAAALPGEPDAMGCGAARTQPTCQVVLGGEGTTPEPSSDGLAQWRVAGWSLNTGLDTDAGPCVLCTRRVHARFQDAEGYASQTYSADVNLDTAPPTVELENWQPGTFVGEGRTLVLALRSTSEAVLWDGGVLLRQGDVGVPMVDGPRFLSYAQWLLTVGNDTPEGPLAVDFSGLRVTDTAGNPAALPDAGTILVDRTAPKVLPGMRGNAFEVSPQGGFVELQFDVTVDNGSGVAPLGSVALASDGGACDLRVADAGVYVCQWVASYGADAGDQSVTLQVEATDQAGNRGVAAVSVQVDGTPPSATFATVFYVPDPQNPLSEVTHARRGTTVRAIVVPSEPVLTEGLSVSFPTAGQAGLVLVQEGADDNAEVLSFLSLRATLDTDVPDGDYPMVVEWQDAVGNRSTLTAPQGGLPFLRVLGSRPSLVFNQERVMLLRSPTGGDLAVEAVLPGVGQGGIDPRGAPTRPARAAPLEQLVGMGADGQPGPLATDQLMETGGRTLRRLRVFEWPAEGPFAAEDGTALGREVANAPLTALGTTLELQPSQGRGVVVSVVDSAGNESAPIPVQRMELRLQPRAPLSGDPADRVFQSAVIPPAPWVVSGQFNADVERHAHPALATVDAVDGGIPDGGGLRVVAAPAWERAARVDVPRSIEQDGVGTVVQDTVRDRFVHLGAAEQMRPNGASALWEFDGDSWVQPTLGGNTTTGRPVAAFDPLSGVTWVFSAAPEGVKVEAWNGADWSTVFADGIALPEGSTSTFLAAAYDPLGARTLVLFGPNTMGVAAAEAYGWDGLSLVRLASPADVSRRPSLVWDGLAGQMLLLDTCRPGPTVQALRPTGWTVVPLENANLLANRCDTSAAARVVRTPPTPALQLLVHSRSAALPNAWLLTRADGVERLEVITSALKGPTWQGVVVHDLHRDVFVQVGRRSTDDGSLSVHHLTANGSLEKGRGPIPATLDGFCVVPAAGNNRSPLVLASTGSAFTTQPGFNRSKLSLWEWTGGAWRETFPASAAGSDSMPTNGFACSPVGGDAWARGDLSATVAVVCGGRSGTTPVTGKVFRLEFKDGLYGWAVSSADGDSGTARTGAAMALDVGALNGGASTARVVLFGGIAGTAPSNDLLELQPGTAGTDLKWVPVPTNERPSARTGHALVSTGNPGEMLLVGAPRGSNDEQVYRLSELNGMGGESARWTPLDIDMPEMSTVAAVRHPQRNSVVVVGFAGASDLNGNSGQEAGELRAAGSSFTYAPLNPTGANVPPLSGVGPLLHDPQTQDVVLALGASVLGSGQTWLLRDPPGRSAGLHALFNLGPAQRSARHLVSVDTQVSASGSGSLWVWRGAGGIQQPGAWEPVAPALVGPYALTTASVPNARNATLTDEDGVPWVALQLRTLPRTNADARPELTVDALELRARFCTLADGAPCP